MKIIRILLIAMMAVPVSQPANAAEVWSDTLSLWNLVLRENTAFIGSVQLPASCSPLRAEIKIFGTDYDKAMYQLALTRFGSGRSIGVLIDDSSSECVVLGIR